MADGTLSYDGRNDERHLDPVYLTYYDLVAFAIIAVISLLVEVSCRGYTCKYLVAKTFSLSPVETYFRQLVTLGMDPHRAALVNTCTNACYFISFAHLILRISSESIYQGTKLSKHELGTKCLLAAVFLMLMLVIVHISDKHSFTIGPTIDNPAAFNVLYYDYGALALSIVLAKWFGQWLAFRR